MPKKVFWPLTMVIMGLIFLASNLGMLPREFWNLWPLILIVVGLGGLLTADRDEWLVETSKIKSRSGSVKPNSAKSKTRKRK